MGLFGFFSKEKNAPSGAEDFKSASTLRAEEEAAKVNPSGEVDFVNNAATLTPTSEGQGSIDPQVSDMRERQQAGEAAATGAASMVMEGSSRPVIHNSEIQELKDDARSEALAVHDAMKKVEVMTEVQETKVAQLEPGSDLDVAAAADNVEAQLSADAGVQLSGDVTVESPIVAVGAEGEAEPSPSIGPNSPEVAG